MSFFNNGAVTFLVGLIIAGLAVKHVSSVLLYGSIFESLRVSINGSMRNGSRIGLILNQLFTCDLCMSTQVSIWLIALPFVIIAQTSYDLANVVLNGNDYTLPAVISVDMIAAAIVTMSVAAVAMGLSGILEYFPNRAKRNEEHRRRVERILGNRVSSISVDVILKYEDFEEILARIDEKSCKGISCSALRKRCRIGALTEQLLRWWKKNIKEDTDSNFERVLFAFESSLLKTSYFQNLRFARKNELPEIRLSAYDEFLRTLQ